MQQNQPFARGNTADIYRDGDTIIKLFHPRFPQDEAEREARKQEVARALGLNVPRVLQVAQFDDRPAIVMEYIRGRNLGERILSSPAQTASLLAEAANLQVRMHRLPGAGLEDMPAKLARNIEEASTLSPGLRLRLRGLLAALPTGDRLCHGDYHPFNLIDTGAGIFILDWVDASSGNPCADAARSWLLYAGHSTGMADAYLHTWCAAAGRGPEDVLAWLPVVAGARLAEGLEPALEALCLALAEKAFA